MKYLVPGLIMFLSGHVTAGVTPEQAYPSCNVQAQRTVQGETGGSISDPLEAHISVRVNVLQADIRAARKARRLTQAQADMLWQHALRVRHDTRKFVKQQGFLSAAERASYDRELDKLAIQLCRKIRQ